jgi:quinohemoprotein ethanol dehydrogenase
LKKSIKVTQGRSRLLEFSFALIWAMTCGNPGGCLAESTGAGTDDWPSYGRDSDEQRFSPLTEIDAGNVGRLGLVWSLDIPSSASLEATPLEVDGTLYFTDSHAVVYAVDARAGRVLWKYDPKVGTAAPERLRVNFAANRGVAFSDGRVFVGTLDGRLIALDASSGRRVWETQTLPRDSGCNIAGAPRAFGNRVIIGQGGAEYGCRGFVTAYDNRSGRQAWRFYVVPGNPRDGFESAAMRMAAKTWSGHWWKYGGGGTPWNAITYDRELKRLYIGTGNSSPYDVQMRTEGKGDNLFLASIVALDAESGKYLWHYQVNPQEAWDYKAAMDIVLADLPIGGRQRKVLMQAPTNGFFYVIDRESGKLLSAEKIGKVTWASRIDLTTGRPVETPGIRYLEGPATIWPSSFGAHNWQAMSFSSQTGLVYIPYMQLGARYSRSAAARKALEAGTSKFPVTSAVSFEFVKEDADDGKGALLAWDPVSNSLRWKVRYEQMWNGGTLATAGNLVFQGTATGEFLAYSADAGRELWSFDAKLGIIAPPISYRVRGRQYISVLVGWGGAKGAVPYPSVFEPLGWKYGLQPRRLLTFALDGAASLPSTPAADFSLRASLPADASVDATAAARGALVYGSACVICHGIDAEAGGLAPDLRESRSVADPAAFAAIVRGGSLTAQGMPKFDDLSAEDVSSIRQYILSRAREVSHAAQ